MIEKKCDNHSSEHKPHTNGQLQSILLESQVVSEIFNRKTYICLLCINATRYYTYFTTSVDGKNLL